MNTSAGIAASGKKKLSSIAERISRRFSLAEIQLATEDFSDSHLIGSGGFGKVYKGLIDDESETVAIKRLAPNSNQGAHEFLTEIETLSKVRHVNLVSLIGYCNDNGEMILVYEYVAHGTLAHHIYGLSGNTDGENCSSLTWKQRLNICIGAGRGLDYLHTGNSIVHRDLKSTNILLDENFMAKGLAKHLTTGNSKSHVSTIVKGSFGYLDPSYFYTGRLTKKSDAYAFGVVLLEVLSGKAALDPSLLEDEMSLVMWAQEKIRKGKVDQIVASSLREEISAGCLKTFVGVAKRCLLLEPKERLTMAQAVVKLEFALEQHERKLATRNASRFLLLHAFWNIVRLPGYRARKSVREDEEQVDVNTMCYSVSTALEEALMVEKEDKQSVSVESFDALAIPLSELINITENFSSKYLVGNGHRRSSYCGVLKSGRAAAIKKVDYWNLPNHEFLSQVSLISRLKHENVAQLLGYCVAGGQQFLAYEYIAHGTLAHHIFELSRNTDGENCSSLTWKQRLNICIGAGQGLDYLHTGTSIIHRDVKSTNILLDENFMAKVSDFSLAKHFTTGNSKSHVSTIVKGSFGYLDPCYFATGRLTKKSDTYSFGVVLLEVLSGRAAIDLRLGEDEMGLVMWALEKINRGKVDQVVASNLREEISAECLKTFVGVAKRCLLHDPKQRPTMSEAVVELQLALEQQERKSATQCISEYS